MSLYRGGSPVRTHEKRDAVEPAIVGYLRARGAMVTRISGAGVPDLLIGWCGKWLLFECKAPNKGLTKAQAPFHEETGRRGLPAYVVRSWEECKDILDGHQRRT